MGVIFIFGGKAKATVASLEPPEAKHKEERPSCQQLLQAVCLISVCSSAAARQHKTELRGIAAFRNTLIMRRMFIWNMSADPSSEVSSLLLPIGLELTAALQRPSSSLSHVGNHLHSFLPPLPMIPTRRLQCVVFLHTHRPGPIKCDWSLQVCGKKTRLVFLVVNLSHPAFSRYKSICSNSSGGGRSLQEKDTLEGWYWTLGLFSN